MSLTRFERLVGNTRTACLVFPVEHGIKFKFKLEKIQFPHTFHHLCIDLLKKSQRFSCKDLSQDTVFFIVYLSMSNAQ